MMKKLTNKTDISDGFVDLLSVSMAGADFTDYVSRYRISDWNQILHIPSAHIEIRCPLFVQLNICKFGFSISTRKIRSMKAFVPTIDQIKAKDHETSLEIHANIEATTAALLLNPKTMAYSGCDTFISQIMCPISMYNEIMVSGNLKQWMLFVSQEHLPSTIEPYRKAVEDKLVSHWHYLEERIGVGK